MSDCTDSTIKLFGRTISVPASHMESLCADISDSSRDDSAGNEYMELTKTEVSAGSKVKSHESSSIENNSEIQSDDEKSSTDQEKEAEEDLEGKQGQQCESSKSQDKHAPKKPNKILPCPRCNSLDTKFCYFNNYNTNQPRHFCKNCQRYWTAGGTMRNVPVGSGRRKNKNSAMQHYHQLGISDLNLQFLRSNSPQSIQQAFQNLRHTVLSFGSDAPLCDSITSVLNLTERSISKSYCKAKSQRKHKIHHLFHNIKGDCGDTQTKISLQQGRALLPHMNINGSVWPYQWSPEHAVLLHPTEAYGARTLPWGNPWPSSPNTPNGSSSGSSPNSSFLGKHSREGNVLNNGSKEKEGTSMQNTCDERMDFTKTPKITDHEHSAKKTLWDATCIKKDNGSVTNISQLFTAFHKQGDHKNHNLKNSHMLHVNPARFIGFQESI